MNMVTHSRTEYSNSDPSSSFLFALVQIQSVDSSEVEGRKESTSPDAPWVHSSTGPEPNPDWFEGPAPIGRGPAGSRT